MPPRVGCRAIRQSRCAGGNQSPLALTACDGRTLIGTMRFVRISDCTTRSSGRSAFGLRDRDLDRRMPPRDVVRFLCREGARAVVLAPLALLGMACFTPPYWLTWVFSTWAPDLQSRATWQVVGGVPIYGIWIAALASLIGMWFGPGAAIGAAVLLPVLAFTSLVAVERETAALKLVRAFLASRQTPLRARASLRRQRAALAAVLDHVKDWLETRRSS